MKVVQYLYFTGIFYLAEQLHERGQILPYIAITILILLDVFYPVGRTLGP